MSETYSQQFDRALAVTTREEADVWMAAETLHYIQDFGKTREEAETIIRANLGYMAGYYDQETSQRIYDLFGAEHPIFGKPDYWTRVSPEEAFRLGKVLGEMSKWRQA